MPPTADLIYIYNNKKRFHHHLEPRMKRKRVYAPSACPDTKDHDSESDQSRKPKRRKILCQHPDGCTTPVAFREGGQRDRCSKHGGFPPCPGVDGYPCLNRTRKMGVPCSYCNPNSATAKRAKKEEIAVENLLSREGSSERNISGVPA